MKKVIGILLTLCMLMTLVPTAFAASTPPDFSDGWTALTSADDGKAFNGGNYYLNDDITIEATIIFSGNVVLDLNGHVLKLNSELYGGSATGSVISLYNIDVNANLCPVNFTLQDSNPTAKHYFSKQTNGLWKLEPTITEATESYELVEGGVITGGIKKEGGGIYAYSTELSVPIAVNINSGNIVGCRAYNNGGGICSRGATVNINGGNIKGCVSGIDGGGICSSGNLTINSGSIKDCLAANGGGVFFGGSPYTFTMNGGKIENCVATTVSGGVLNCGAAFKMTGGSIKNCTSMDTGTNAYCSVDSGTMYADGGVIDGTANVFGRRDNIKRSDNAKGTTVFNEKVTYGGTIYAGIFYGGLEKSSGDGQIIGSTYTVDFYENSTDTEPFATAFIVGDGTKLVPPTTSKTFDAWYTESGDEYKFDSAVASDFSLYAKHIHTNHADSDNDGLCDTCGEDVPTESTTPTAKKTLADYVIAVVYEALMALVKIIVSVVKSYI